MSKGSLDDCLDFCRLAIHNTVCSPIDAIQITDPLHIFNTAVQIRIDTELTSAQEDIVHSYFSTDKIIINTSRQVGLSSIINSLYIYDALFNAKRTNIIILPSTGARSSTFDALIRMLYAIFTPFITQNLVSNKCKYKIEFKNGSVIEVHSISDGYASSAFKLSRIVHSKDMSNIYLENFTSWDSQVQREIYNELRMVTSQRRCAMIISSVPGNKYVYYRLDKNINIHKPYRCPKTGDMYDRQYSLFYRLFKDKNFDRLKIPAKYNELVNQENLKQHKRNMGKDRFGAEFECKFINNKP